MCRSTDPWREGRSRLQRARLCLIVGPDEAAAGDPIDAAAAAVRGGVDLLQVRFKGRPALEIARAVERLRHACPGVPILVNDDVDAALASGADGVHLGQDDLPLRAARERLGPAALIGASTHGLVEARTVEAEGIADDIGLGAMFGTRTKPGAVVVGPDVLAEVLQHVALPVFAIGGITPANVGRLVERGCARIAVSHAILGAVEPERAAAELRRALERVPLAAR